MPPAISFREALAGAPGAHVALIAEVKRRSPSKGVINAALSAADRAADYVRGGAAAISVLTEPERFGGSLHDLWEVGTRVRVPLLRKDFITHRVQLLEARAVGASAVLLIVRALPPATLARLAKEATELGLDVLAEIRDERELEDALAIPGAVIGVNNRDLETLIIEPEVGDRMIPLVPAGRVAVYESGIEHVAQVEHAAAIGADAVLVGSILSRAGDGAAAAAALASVKRVGRG